MTPEKALATANLELDRLQARVDNHHEMLEAIKSSKDISEKYRGELRAEQENTHLQAMAAVHRRVSDLLDQTSALADATLAAPPGAGDPTAAARVQAALATMAPSDVSDVLAEMGDLTGLRELRRQLPLWVAARYSQPTERTRFTRQLLDAIDERLAATAGDDKRAALAARNGVEATRARLESLWNFSSRPTGPRRLNLAYASPQVAS